MLFPSALALIAAEFEGRARTRAIGIWGATVSAAIAAGPLLGGVLVQAISWRATFLVGLALAVPTGLAGAMHLRESRAPNAGRVDVTGTITLTAAIFLAVFALLRGNQSGWTSPAVLGSAIAAVLLFGLFVAVEHRVSDPLIAPALMRNRTFMVATLVALVFAASGFGPIVFLTQLLIRVLRGSPIAAGAELLPFAFASFVVSLLAGRGVDRTSTRTTLAGGLLVCAAGLIAMRGVGAHGSWAHLIPGLLLWGVGSGLVNPTMTVAALAEVEPSRSGMASGVNNAARQLGIAAGIAALGALVQSQTTSSQRRGMTFGASYTHAVDVMLLVAGGIAAAGAVLVVGLIRAR
jgi:predicted MFS family arabinose efflux permease